MKRILTISAVALLALTAGCTSAQIQTAAATPAGALFCSIQLNGGGSMLATIVDAEASAAAPVSAPVAVLVTGMTKAYVDDACTRAAANIAGATSGVAVSPPAAAVTVATVAVKVPAVATP